MINEEINRTLHEFMGHSDWHILEEYTIAGEYVNCNHCDKTIMEHIEENPDYCSDDSPRRLLNEVVAKVLSLPDSEVKVGDTVFHDISIAQKFGDELDKLFDGFNKTPYYEVSWIILAAEQIATACYHAIKEQAK